MRSAIYSVLTSLMLLVPVCAVPCMAIFGVPQFTPVVASPLDELDEEEWQQPTKKTPKKAVTALEQEFDLAAEDDWNWEDVLKESRRTESGSRLSQRTSAGKSRSKTGSKSGPETLTTKSAGTSTKARTKTKQPRKLPEDLDEEPDQIQQTGHAEVVEDESGAILTADHLTESGTSPMEDQHIPAGIPSYRRQRTNSAEDASRTSDTSAPRAKRSSPAPQLTWKKAVERLNELGIRNFRLDPGMRPGEFTFTCSYTPSQTPHVTRKFEAEADDPLKAVAQVLAQVERWAQQREPEASRQTADSRDE